MEQCVLTSYKNYAMFLILLYCLFVSAFANVHRCDGRIIVITVHIFESVCVCVF